MRPTGEAVRQVSPDHATAVRVLYSECCPGGEASARLLREALSETAPGTEIETIDLSSRAFFGPKRHPTVGMVRDALRERGVGSVAGR